jgi:hypothetical protein
MLSSLFLPRFSLLRWEAHVLDEMAILLSKFHMDIIINSSRRFHIVATRAVIAGAGCKPYNFSEVMEQPEP